MLTKLQTSGFRLQAAGLPKYNDGQRVSLKRAATFPMLFALTLADCARPAQSGQLIDRYKIAGIPVRGGSGSGTWDYTLRTRESVDVRSVGAQAPGGRIVVVFTLGAKNDVAADAGDYIYPADVRVDTAAERLYIKASGSPAALGGSETWLFEYDIQHRRQTERLMVAAQVLPQECRVTQ